MACEYCTPKVDQDTGESLEFCREFCFVDELNENTLIRTGLIQDKDDGKWSRIVLMADRWPERVDISHFPLVVTFDAPPYCPHCGRRLT